MMRPRRGREGFGVNVCLCLAELHPHQALDFQRVGHGGRRQAGRPAAPPVHTSSVLPHKGFVAIAYSAIAVNRRLSAAGDLKLRKRPAPQSFTPTREASCNAWSGAFSSAFRPSIICSHSRCTSLAFR